MYTALLQTRIGVIMFSDAMVSVLHLYQGTSSAAINTAIDDMKHLNSLTNMASGINGMVSEFDSMLGDRPGHYLRPTRCLVRRVLSEIPPPVTTPPPPATRNHAPSPRPPRRRSERRHTDHGRQFHEETLGDDSGRPESTRARHKVVRYRSHQ